MLKYQLSRQVFDNDIVTLNYNNINYNDFPTENDVEKIMVELECDDASFVSNSDVLSFVGTMGYYNQDLNSNDYIGYSGKVSVYAVNYITNSVYFLDDKYMELDLSDIYAEVENGVITWVIEFDKTHFIAEGDYVDLFLLFGPKTKVHLDNQATLENVNYYQIKWTYDSMVENAQELSNILFGDIDASVNQTIYGDINKVTALREQVRWARYDIWQEPPNVTLNKYKVNLKVPLSLKTKIDLYSEGNIKEYFVDYEQQKSVNTPIEMEKYVYTPVVVSKLNHGSPVFEDCMKINFNLHFRAHDGDDWTVNNSDSWNFEKYGDYSNWTKNKYYSYTPSPTSPNTQNQWKRSCQSDLLKYVGFVTNDVKYQKNKLKKSFLRIFYYDSDNPATQNLLGYSTVFMDCNKLYSKFISKANFECYYDDNGEIVKGIKTDREVSVNDLTKILKWSGMTTEEIEDYRLSSQITVKNKYLSDNSSEGFYLYKWEGEDEDTIPNDVYMKIEFNHAGYGRNVPMMAPYKDGQVKGFKTNNEIIDDWSNTSTQYGIKRYTRYSYIHLKTKYDTNTNRRIYYLDPDTYGVNKDGNIININLYEARIAFND